MNNLSCPVCSDSNVDYLFKAGDYHGHQFQSHQLFAIHRCLSCQAIFPQVKINSQYYSRYYQPTYYPAPSFINSLLTATANYFKGKILKKYQSSSTVNILDLGCGQGEFLHSLSSSYSKTGIDLNNAPKSPSFNFIQGNFLRTKFNQSFDVITAWHALEHFSDPSNVIAKISQISNHGALLVFAVPNHDCLGFTLGQKYWFHLDSPRHLFIPNYQTVSTILADSDFKIISSYSAFYEFPLDLFWSIRHHWAKIFIYPLYPLFKLFDPQTVVYICQKK